MKAIVIGGGAAGMMAACTAAGNGHDVTVLERNEKTCRKLCITGKGRCNVTNACTREEFFASIRTNPRFLYSSYAAFTSEDAQKFFEDAGVPLKIERGNRVFPVSDSAYDIADALLHTARNRGVRIVQGRAFEITSENGAVTGVRYESDGVKKFLSADAVILTTGGASYPLTGSTGDGYSMLKALGHTIVEPQGSLVPLEAPDCAPMQGLSLKNTGMKLYNGGKVVYEDFGELLFTHFGLSGPVILSASAFMRGEGQWKVVLDLKPALDETELDARLLRDFSEAPNKSFANVLGGLAPRLMIPELIRRSGISGAKPVNIVTKKERARLVQTFKRMEFPITGKRPIAEAIVTAGGVNVREFDPKTLASKLVRGLYCAGEILDVDAFTGGFNLQIAWSTGFAAGKLG